VINRRHGSFQFREVRNRDDILSRDERRFNRVIPKISFSVVINVTTTTIHKTQVRFRDRWNIVLS